MLSDHSSAFFGKVSVQVFVILTLDCLPLLLEYIYQIQVSDMFYILMPFDLQKILNSDEINFYTVFLLRLTLSVSSFKKFLLLKTGNIPFCVVF